MVSFSLIPGKYCKIRMLHVEILEFLGGSLGRDEKFSRKIA